MKPYHISPSIQINQMLKLNIYGFAQNQQHLNQQYSKQQLSFLNSINKNRIEYASRLNPLLQRDTKMKA